MKNRDVLKLLQNLPKNTKEYIDTVVPKTYAGSDTAGGVATEAAKLSNSLLIACGAIQGGTRVQFNGSSSQLITINPATIGAAYSSHKHNYAGSDTAGGVATEAAKTTGTLTIQTNGTSALTFNGSANKSLDITPDNIGAALAEHTHSNYALTTHTHSYAGSDSAGGIATQAAKTTGTLTIQTNGTSALTFNGSANKSLDITPDNIGAALAEHTHDKYITLEALNDLDLTRDYSTNTAYITNSNGDKLNQGLRLYDVVYIRPSNFTDLLEKASTNNIYYLLTTVKVTYNNEDYSLKGLYDIKRTTNGGWNLYGYNNLINIVVNSSQNITNLLSLPTYISNKTATSLKTMIPENYAGSDSAGGIATQAAKTTGTLTIQTNGTSALTFNGSANKSLDITPDNIGAALAKHTHSNYALTTHTHPEYSSSSHTHGLLNSTFCKELDNTTSGGWSLLNSDYQGFLLMSLRTNANTPNWIIGNYSSGIAFGGSDTKGVISVSYQSPLVKFAGGNGTEPVWNFSLTGTSEGYYNMDNFATKTDLGNIDAILDSINGISL